MAKPPITLAIETSNPALSETDHRCAVGVALGIRDVDGCRDMGWEPLTPRSRQDDDLAPAIDRLTRAHGITPQDLSLIAVSVGPGGFTGLRIAIATAKMIAVAVGARCVAVPTAEVVACSVAGNGSRFGVALASKHDAVHLSLFDGDGRPAGVPGSIVADKLKDHRMGRLFADRHLPDAFRAECLRQGIVVEPPLIHPLACLARSWDLPSVDPGELVPIYPREPEAVTRWREHHGS
ncbi:MAG: tRNA (adenosine(37)-N6)-threonylcarbamoyltransferase complex dimerization subunit type 1 TsaB [Phycisphaeraceae bacterium]|nr:tRNA (adenosine(37)-N6)-threonylcarbamoyltransferase complex dimerization subunit type 1 TsaB [Phycisphaeraceae bacterium]